MEKEIISVKNIFLASATLIGLSMIAWHYSLLSTIIVVTFFAATLFITSRSISNGLLVAVFEIFIGSLGRFFTTTGTLPLNLSLRLAIFSGLMIGTIYYLLNNKLAQKLLVANLKNVRTCLIIFPIILFSIIVGLFKNSPGLVYNDANAWIFYGLLFPALAITYDERYFNKILKIFIGTSLTTICLTIIIYVLYGWGLISEPIFSWLYLWLRQVGWGEVTHVTGNLYRVFSQSHIMILALWSFCLSIITFKKFQIINEKSTQLLLFLTTIVLLINLSRSMWVGCFCLILFFFISNCKKLLSNWKPLLIIVIGAILTSGLLIGRLGFISLASRASQQPSEPAIASRLVQLKPLYNGIKSHWLIGSGFGGQVGYPSQDPRAKMHLDDQGLFWTSAFEWGYLDQLFKFGLVIFLIFMCFVVKIFKSLYKNNNVLILSALIAIATTHIFSPFLNHPLGISWLIAGIIAINNTNYDPTNNN